MVTVLDIQGGAPAIAGVPPPPEQAAAVEVSVCALGIGDRAGLLAGVPKFFVSCPSSFPALFFSFMNFLRYCGYSDKLSNLMCCI